jgi:hypothetical protein
MTKYLLLLLTTLLALRLSAQEKDSAWKFTAIENDYFYKGRPSIDLFYGGSWLSLKNSGLDFENSPMFELVLGYTFKGTSKYAAFINRYRNNYAFLNFGPVWKFGCGNATGYGYKVGDNASIILYNSNSVDWTRYDAGNPVITEFNEFGGDNYHSTTQDFNKTFRFGTGTEAGIMLPFGRVLYFHLQFDRTLVFPRHLVWKHLGSVIIEAVAQTSLDGFIHAVFRTSPGAGPIVNFLLKNGLAYGLYELRREKMNWPFESAEPMLFDSFKAGINFTF